MNAYTSSAGLAFCKFDVPRMPVNVVSRIQRVDRRLTLPRQEKNPIGSGLCSSDCSSSSSSDATDPSRLFELMSPIESVQPDQMSASALAYLGDVVFELFVRSRYVWPERRMSDLQNKVVSIVRADAQALLLKNFIKRFPLTPSEKSVLSRGRNANLSARKKMKGMGKTGGAGAADFQDSTAFEALLGYTFISDKHRFVDMIDAIRIELDEMGDK